MKRIIGVLGALALGCGLTLATGVTAAGANTVTVVKDGQSIQAAVNAAHPGDTIVVLGWHAEGVTVHKPLHLWGWGATIDAKGHDNGVLLGPGASGSNLEGFHILHATGEGILASQVDHVTITHNHVHRNDLGATSPSTYPECQAQGEVPGDCGEGVHLQTVNDSKVLFNDVEHNVGGILVSDDLGPAHDNLIAGNTAANNQLDCGITLPSHRPGAGVYHNLVAFNFVSNNGGAGVLMAASAPGTASHDNRVVANLIIGNQMPGVTIHAHTPNQNVDGNRIEGNAIGTNNLSGDPDAGVMDTTGVLVFSAVVPVHGTVVSHNLIFGDHFGVWLSANVDAGGVGGNHDVNVAVPVQH